MTYDEIKTALADLATEMADIRQNHGFYAQEYMSAQRDWKKSWAMKFLEVEGKNKEEREARVIQSLWQSEEYTAFVRAEANWEGSKARLDAAKQNAIVLLGMLKDEKDLSYGNSGPNPVGWSGRN